MDFLWANQGEDGGKPLVRKLAMKAANRLWFDARDLFEVDDGRVVEHTSAVSFMPSNARRRAWACGNRPSTSTSSLLEKNAGGTQPRMPSSDIQSVSVPVVMRQRLLEGHRNSTTMWEDCVPMSLSE